MILQLRVRFIWQYIQNKRQLKSAACVFRYSRCCVWRGTRAQRRAPCRRAPYRRRSLCSAGRCSVQWVGNIIPCPRLRPQSGSLPVRPIAHQSLRSVWRRLLRILRDLTGGRRPVLLVLAGSKGWTPDPGLRPARSVGRPDSPVVVQGLDRHRLHSYRLLAFQTQRARRKPPARAPPPPIARGEVVFIR